MNSNKTKLITVLDNYQDSYNELLQNSDYFGTHFNNPYYIKCGPLRDCRTIYLTPNVPPKLFNDLIDPHLTISNIIKEKFPLTVELYKTLLDFLNLNNAKTGRTYITMLPSGKKIFPHVDIGNKYFNAIDRYQFYYRGNKDMIQLIHQELFPIGDGFLYFFDHTKCHEYTNNSDADMVVMVFDIFKNDYERFF